MFCKRCFQEFPKIHMKHLRRSLFLDKAMLLKRDFDTGEFSANLAVNFPEDFTTFFRTCFIEHLETLVNDLNEC